MPDEEVLLELGSDAELVCGARASRTGKGCDRCHHTGYRGRIGIFEIMIIDDESLRRSVLARRLDPGAARGGHPQRGMRTLREIGHAGAVTPGARPSRRCCARRWPVDRGRAIAFVSLPTHGSARSRRSAAPRPQAATSARRGRPRPAPARRRGGRLKGRLVTDFTVQLATLSEARASRSSRRCAILEGQTRPGPFKDVLAELVEDVEAGTPLSEALAKHGRLRPALLEHGARRRGRRRARRVLKRLAVFRETAPRDPAPGPRARRSIPLIVVRRRRGGRHRRDRVGHPEVPGDLPVLRRRAARRHAAPARHQRTSSSRTGTWSSACRS